MIAAVFDLDRTLLPGTTAERIYLRHLVRHRVLGFGAAAHIVRYAVDSGLNDIFLRVRAERPYLIGLHDATLRLYGRRCAIEEILPALSQRGLDFLHWHQDRGHHPVLLSGSLPYAVEPLARELGIRNVICSQLDLESQRVTGRLKGLHPYGIAKATLMLEYGKANDVEFKVSYCYADHHTDESLMQLFGNPVCVNPSSQLRAIATENDWRIEEFD
jgi:putative phosphoserine phosphatase / 1-acylglycerol-3-phosphate O-acyltransferase